MKPPYTRVRESLPFGSPARRAVLRGQRQRDSSLWTPFLRCGGNWNGNHRCCTLPCPPNGWRAGWVNTANLFIREYNNRHGSAPPPRHAKSLNRGFLFPWKSFHKNLFFDHPHYTPYFSSQNRYFMSIFLVFVCLHKNTTNLLCRISVTKPEIFSSIIIEGTTRPKPGTGELRL